MKYAVIRNTTFHGKPVIEGVAEIRGEESIEDISEYRFVRFLSDSPDDTYYRRIWRSDIYCCACDAKMAIHKEISVGEFIGRLSG